MRLGDADREALFAQLSAQAAAGRLDVAELERRVAILARADTREQADAVLSDLPRLPPAPSASERRRRALFSGRGHGEASAAHPEWTPTDERFRDPVSQQVMRVWTDPSGSRHYLPDGA